MANVAAYKKIGPVFTGELGYAKLTYDFANDAGAQGTLVLAEINQKILVTRALIHVETAGAGTGATVNIGTAGSASSFLDVTSGAVANLTDDAVLFEDAGQIAVLQSTDVINLVIATANLTAGKINVHLWFVPVA